MENQIVKIMEETGLEPTKAEIVVQKFSGFFQEARVWEKKAKEIVVNDETDKGLMDRAREARLELKKIRVNAENTRKELKEQSLREGKAIDGIANIIKAIIVPIEEHLEKQEKFAEYKEAERKETIRIEREEMLRPFVEDVSFFNLKEMSEAGFNQLLQSSKSAMEAQKEAEKKAEADRVAKEKEEAEERERIRKENEKLKKEAEAREKELEKERAKAEVARTKLEAQRKKEAEAREKAERELREQKEAQARAEQEAKAKEEAEETAREEAKHQAELAPDKEKILAFSNAIASVSVPKCTSLEGIKAIEQAEKEIRMACKKMCKSVSAL